MTTYLSKLKNINDSFFDVSEEIDVIEQMISAENEAADYQQVKNTFKDIDAGVHIAEQLIEMDEISHGYLAEGKEIPEAVKLANESLKNTALAGLGLNGEYEYSFEDSNDASPSIFRRIYNALVKAFKYVSELVSKILYWLINKLSGISSEAKQYVNILKAMPNDDFKRILTYAVTSNKLVIPSYNNDIISLKKYSENISDLVTDMYQILVAPISKNVDIMKNDVKSSGLIADTKIGDRLSDAQIEEIKRKGEISLHNAFDISDKFLKKYGDVVFFKGKNMGGKLTVLRIVKNSAMQKAVSTYGKLDRDRAKDSISLAKQSPFIAETIVIPNKTAVSGNAIDFKNKLIEAFSVSGLLDTVFNKTKTEYSKLENAADSAIKGINTFIIMNADVKRKFLIFKYTDMSRIYETGMTVYMRMLAQVISITADAIRGYSSLFMMYKKAVNVIVEHKDKINSIDG